MDVKEMKDVFEISKDLNDLSRKVGTVAFQIKYSSTDGNKDIHKRFLEYAFKNANNEYLVAIGKLLDLEDFDKRFSELEDRLAAMEVMVLEHLEKCNTAKVDDSKDVKKDVKVF